MLEKANLLGALVAVAFFSSAILVFIFRLLGRPQVGHWIGYFEFLLAIPLLYLLLQAPRLELARLVLHPDWRPAGLVAGGGAPGLHSSY